MFYSSLALLAGEIAAAWLFPPTAPAAEALATALTRVAVRIIGREALDAILARVARMAGARFVKFFLKHAAIDTALGTFQELGIQEWQVIEGHRKDINWTQAIVTTVSSAAGGMAAGPLGEWAGNRLSHAGVNHLVAARITGMGAGIVGAGAGFVAATGTQFVADVLQHGWDKAVENLPQQAGAADDGVLRRAGHIGVVGQGGQREGELGVRLTLP